MTDLHIGELNLSEVLRQHRTRHAKQYQELGRAIDDLERLLASKKDEYDRSTRHLRDIDGALRYPDQVRHVSKSGTVRTLQDEVDPLHTTEGSAGEPTLHEQIDYYKTLIAGFEREKHPSAELIEELMHGGLAIAQTAKLTLTVDKGVDDSP